MNRTKLTLNATLTAILCAGLSACSDGGGTTPDMAKNSDMQQPADMTVVMPKSVYTMTNETTENQIAVYKRAADGTLTAFNNYATGGRGTGAALQSQGSLVYDDTQKLLFAVNAGDNTVSMMAVQNDGSLTLLSRQLTGGFKPVSVTVSGSLVFVLNAGDQSGAASIQGFQISGSTLTQLQNSNKPLSAMSPGPAQIQFASNGKLLVVTEKSTNKLTTYTVDSGTVGNANPQMSKGMSPYGFAVTANQQLVVSEAGTGAASSYSIGTGGTLTAVSSSISSGQTAPCWVSIVNNTAYVTNAGSNNISSYNIGTDGTLSLLNGTAGTTGMAPTDEDATDGNEYLYVLNSKDHSFSIFGINSDKSLTKKTDFTGLPMNAVGLVAR